MIIGVNRLFALRGFGFCELVELDVSEIQCYVNRNFDEVEHVEEEAQIEDEARAVHRDDLYNLSRDTERVAYQQEYLEEQALSLCRARYVGLADRNRP